MTKNDVKNVWLTWINDFQLWEMSAKRVEQPSGKNA